MVKDREYEIRFEVGKDKFLDLIKLLDTDIFCGFAKKKSSREKILDQYFDTGNYILARSGALYRHRFYNDNDKDFSITFKKEINKGDITDMVELRANSDTDTYFISRNSKDYFNSQMPPVIEARKITGNEKVMEVLSIINRCTPMQFSYNGTSVEVAIDNVSFITPNFKLKQAYGFEVELLEGDKNIADRFARNIETEYGLKRSKHNKYTKGLLMHNLLPLPESYH